MSNPKRKGKKTNHGRQRLNPPTVFGASLEDNIRKISEFRNLIGISDNHNDSIDCNSALLTASDRFRDKKIRSISETTFTELSGRGVNIYPEASADDPFSIKIKMLDTLPYIWLACLANHTAPLRQYVDIDGVLGAISYNIRLIREPMLRSLFSGCFKELRRLLNFPEEDYGVLKTFYSNIIIYYNNSQILKRYITEDIDPFGYDNFEESYTVNGNSFRSYPIIVNGSGSSFIIQNTWFGAVRDISILDRAGDIIRRDNPDFFVIIMGFLHLGGATLKHYFQGEGLSRLLVPENRESMFPEGVIYYSDQETLVEKLISIFRDSPQTRDDDRRGRRGEDTSRGRRGEDTYRGRRGRRGGRGRGRR